MDSLTSGTFAGAGSFRCAGCDYTLTLNGSDVLPDCPGCGGREFVRASLFSTERIAAGATSTSITGAGEGTLAQPPAADREAQLAHARELIEQPGEYLCYEENGEPRTVALTREWTRIGRSLAADLRFDDPTVSAPPRADRAPARRRARARRPQPQRRVRQRRPRGRKTLQRRRRDPGRALPPDVPERAARPRTRRRARR